MYWRNEVVTYDDLVRMHDRNPKRRNPKHDGSPTRGELKAARRAARQGKYTSRTDFRPQTREEHVWALRAREQRAPDRSRSGSGSKASQLISVLGLLYFWESQDPDFWDNLPNDPNGKRTIKSMWILAKQMGISTKAALDNFKAQHHRAIMAAAAPDEPSLFDER
jgi:hypothetical protein